MTQNCKAFTKRVYLNLSFRDFHHTHCSFDVVPNYELDLLEYARKGEGDGLIFFAQINVSQARSEIRNTTKLPQHRGQT